MEHNDLRTPSGVAISELIVTVFRLNGRLLAAGDRLVAGFGLTSARWQILGAIALSPVPEPVARLARNMGLNRQGVQRIVGELLSEGFIEAKDNPHHRSAKLIVMTAKGLNAYAAALQAQAPWVNMLGEGVDAKAIEDADRILDVLRQRLERPSSKNPNEKRELPLLARVTAKVAHDCDPATLVPAPDAA